MSDVRAEVGYGNWSPISEKASGVRLDLMKYWKSDEIGVEHQHQNRSSILQQKSDIRIEVRYENGIPT